MSYGIGLDCGTTSVGWAVMALDENDEPRRIIKLGSRIFPLAQNPKDGSSLALPRREKRSLRRRLRRSKHRKERIKALIVNSGILTQDELDNLFTGTLSNVYALRVDALNREVNPSEFSRILINIAQRRGFKSNRKNSAKKDEGLLLSAISENEKIMSENGYRTVGEMLYCDERYKDSKRNKGENYTNTVSRDMIEDEVHKIFDAQRKYGNKFANEQFEEEYCNILLSQRSFEDGPGGNSKYGGPQIEKMIGQCTLIPEESRAVKASYSFQLFNLWQRINNLKIVSVGGSRVLTGEEREIVFNLAHTSDPIKFSTLRKKLKLQDDELFNLVSYSGNEKDKVENKTFVSLKEYHAIRKALDKVKKGRISEIPKDTLNKIAYIFTVYKEDTKIGAALNNLELEQADISELLKLENFSKVGHISVRACDMLLPYLEQGMSYSDACKNAGFEFKAHSSEKSVTLPGYSPEISDLKNAVVKRAVTQTIRVINAIIREQGESPVYINIEVARDLTKTLKERNDIQKNQEENQAKNERTMQRLREEFGLQNPTGQDLVKFKLWEEQDGICPYSQKHIPIDHLFDYGYAEVDHIFPYSISFDDSYNNKVLVLAKENRDKGNRLPLQYLTGKRRDDYIVWVNSNSRYRFRKKKRLLKEDITENDRKDFKARDLQDTQYLSRFLYNYINDRLEFAPSVSGKIKRVTTVNGAITAYMRKRWGIVKIREDGDLHHAADAAVIACVTNGMIKRISDHSKRNELRYTVDIESDSSLVVNKYTGEVIDKFPMPWENFRTELEIRLANNPQVMLGVVLSNYTSEELLDIKPSFVSRKVNRKITGSANDDTVRSPKAMEQGYAISKVPLTSLKVKNGEIENYYKPESDLLLYNALKARLLLFGNNAQEAFSEKFYKPTASGEKGPLVKKVKLITKSTLNVPLNGGKGMASNGEMVRIDVFRVESDGYYFVPIYVADTVKKELPNKAVVAAKPYSEWKEMREEDFVFSLYPNDLIKVTAKKPLKMSLNFNESSLPNEHYSDGELLYYRGADISTASIGVVTHDNSYVLKSLGIKRLTKIEKYEVDVLGNVRCVLHEKRTRFGK